MLLLQRNNVCVSVKMVKCHCNIRIFFILITKSCMLLIRLGIEWIEASSLSDDTEDDDRSSWELLKQCDGVGMLNCIHYNLASFEYLDLNGNIILTSKSILVLLFQLSLADLVAEAWKAKSLQSNLHARKRCLSWAFALECKLLSLNTVGMCWGLRKHTVLNSLTIS